MAIMTDLAKNFFVNVKEKRENLLILLLYENLLFCAIIVESIQPIITQHRRSTMCILVRLRDMHPMVKENAKT